MNTTEQTPDAALTGLTIHSSFLPHTDADASLAFYRDVLGFDVRLDVGGGRMRWITVGPHGQPDTAIVLQPVLEGNGITGQEHAALLSVIAKGACFGVNLATGDVDATFAALEASGADIVQEPIDQDYGIRDCAVRDPAGNMLRIQELRS